MVRVGINRIVCENYIWTKKSDFTGNTFAIGATFAVLTHTELDPFTHDYTDLGYPFRDVTVSLGSTFHAWDRLWRWDGTWPIVLGMIAASVALSFVRGAWTFLFH